MPDLALITLSGKGEFHLFEKKSEFIGYASPVSTETEALAFVSEIKKKHADARHNVSAYVCGNIAHSSDDGEPQGTGGAPVLEVIKKNGLDGAAIVVTRYFGGILLGAGGLVRAYSAAAAGAVENAGIARYEKFTECVFSCAYGDYERLLYEAGKFSSMTDGVDFGEKVTVRCAVLSCEYDLFSKRISEMTGGKVTVCVTGDRFDTKK